MGTVDKAPLDLMKQDPVTGLYKLGSVEMTASEYSLHLSLNKVHDQITDLQKRLTEIEGK